MAQKMEKKCPILEEDEDFALLEEYPNVFGDFPENWLQFVKTSLAFGLDPYRWRIC